MTILLPICLYIMTSILPQEKSLKAFQKMAGIISSKSREKATLASVINDTAVIVGTGLVNVIRASSESARVFGKRATKDNHLSVNHTKEKVTASKMGILSRLHTANLRLQTRVGK